MTTTFNLRRLLHRKAWEMCTPSPVNTAAGSVIVSDKFNLIPNSLAYLITGVSSIYRYDGDQDSWLQLPNSGLPGAFGAGAGAEFRALGAMGGIFTQTATGGGVATINTSRTIVRNLTGLRIRVVAGTGLGYDGTITFNTIGANSVLTVSGSTTFDSTTQFQIFSGSLWLFVPGTSAVGFGVYDLATNAWTAKSVTNLPTAFGTDGQLVSTMGSVGYYAQGTATSGSSTTLVNSGKSWLTNQWANYQIRIVSGTGAGQIRSVASNTSNTITVSSAWAVSPDNTSVYQFEGNEDFFYLIGNNAVTMYRYQISTNTWTTLSPTVARGGVAGAGASLNWIDSVTTWVLNANDSPINLGSIVKQNGRYLFSFRGGGTNILDVYDIAANTWINNLSYGNQLETFTTGTASVDYGGQIYLQKENSGRIFKFNIDTWTMQSFALNPVVQGATIAGQKMFILPYVDGGTEIDFLYTQQHTGNTLFRTIMI